MMDVYKKSPLGKIPNDWEVLSTDDIGEITSSKRVHRADYTKNGVPFFRGKEISQLAKGDKLSDIVYIKTETYNDLKSKFGAPESGDILITAVGTIGSIYLVKEGDKFYFKDGNLMWIRNISDRLNRRFLMHYLRSSIFQNFIDLASGGSSQKALTIVKFKRLFIPVPNELEQQKIAEILSTVDAKIEVIDQQISQTQELKQGLMQRLLTKGIGHTEFKDSPLGKIPKSWEVLNLGDISEVKGRIGYRGYTKADLVEKGEGALAIGGAQINKQNRLNLSNPVYLNWEKYEESPEIKVNVGNIVFAQRGTLGRTALIESLPERATINPSMVLIKNITCDNKLLFYYLCSSHVQSIVSSISTATAVPMISQKQIKDFKIGIPPRCEQERISDILSSVDDKLDVLTEKKKSYKKLKKGLMQQLLTGKIRVKPNTTVTT